MKLVAAIAIAMLTAAPAFAGQCQDDLAAVDQALATGTVSPDTKAQVEDIRNQAVQLCGAGNEQEGVDVLSEAKAMLAIE